VAQNAQTEPAVQVSEAVAVYREGVALDGVTLNVAPGEFLGLLGPNGSGKTTLLTAINGLRPLRSGTIRVFGIEPRGRQGRRVRARTGYVAQVRRVDPRLPITVRESVLCGTYGRLGWLRRPGRRERERAEEAIAEAGLSRLADRPIGHLSGGEAQRVAIARALVQEPELFLFDEPTASIDPRAQEEIIALIQRIQRRRGVAAVYVTHELATLPAACERLVMLKSGRIWRDGPRGRLLRPEVLDELYDGAGPPRMRAVAS
jgi:ABC-type Mn2+/Zn2+ transport system ATPase subunit